jgi:hypothetical protein
MNQPILTLLTAPSQGMIQMGNDPMYMSGQYFKNDPYAMGAG